MKLLKIALTRLQNLREATRQAYFGAFNEKTVLIFSGEHNAYWRENGCGYTTEKSEAGIYSLNDAYAKTSHCDAEKQIYFIEAEK